MRTQTQTGRDVTREHVTAKDRLQAARAERRSLLRRLELATTDEEAEAIRRRLDIVAGEINGLRSQLRSLRLRTDYAVVTVSLLPKDGDSGGGGAGGSFDDALGDAGDLLVGVAGRDRARARGRAAARPDRAASAGSWAAPCGAGSASRRWPRRILAVVAPITAIHFTDPACPWAYSARPAHAPAALALRRPDRVAARADRAERVGRGLRGACYTPDRLLRTQHVFGERFGMPYSFERKPRMAGTARACRAIVAAREIDPALGEAALRALQLMHFTTADLLDDDDDLALGPCGRSRPGRGRARRPYRRPRSIAAYEADRALARSAEGSPTHAQDRFSTSDGPVRYTAPSVIFEDEHGARLEVGGFQPFEAYDTVLANLDVELERRPAPGHMLEALLEFPDGLTTAELASVMRPSDLVDADLEATATEAAELAEAGTVLREPAGRDALWRAADAARRARTTAPKGTVVT